MHDSFRPLMFDCTKSEICLQKVLFIGSWTTGFAKVLAPKA